ncbi:carbamoyl-phosphate synthase (glutamine-hydrolyzing) large subunit [Aquibacillus koreensis]|uniref:Carbamoyl phosphate synthase large chain n=1 Tax=Aquibacillus koreensis TaxID=279446 RepID=A0A9X3WLZ5_9BACI|nr:carbamoyl-phosphate synthase (glutamine-hydrolyzing) large subunit [Aquibacillus koreensis]MCT2534899.1 carbamoyl-phosphate synthase (glutamine-hydrolyzing) large subunit [Aquibacillus koreensis]MDC3422207.1 carbamoyl-phosphate synthase (glutamine-hydrolyzing) large subunit [Aquibacillus koreensis]
MPKFEHIKKVLVIGSGPIVIGQAAEFDYAGTQACLALKEEGVEVILVNNNPATIMTDENIADKVYLEPLTLESITKIIEKEQPDGLLPTLGGQTGLNMAILLTNAGVLEKHKVELLGTPLDTIQKGEDREIFKSMMKSIDEPVAESKSTTSVEEAVTFAKTVGYPLIVRPAYTLGGAGGGIAKDEQHLRTIVKNGLYASPINQVLIEQSVKGWKEIEYEVMRDANDTCIIVCNMENFDPVGVHTGDSIVVAPSQTLNDRQYQMLRTSSCRVIRELGVIGGCNIQFALNPESNEYIIIEVNPRVSRSSALASKATGYPIARIAAKVALGYHLDEVINPITGDTYASFEPAIDYIALKIPRWPFDKFTKADRLLGTQMKATGEVMALARNFPAALNKAVRSLEIGLDYVHLPSLEKLTDAQINHELDEATDDRLFVVAEALRRGYTVDAIHDITAINKYFLHELSILIHTEKDLKQKQWADLSDQTLKKAKLLGFTDQTLATLLNVQTEDVRKRLETSNLAPSYKMVDTCAAEFSAETPYFYSSWNEIDEVEPLTGSKRMVVLGSGPIRIGQGVEFDYCSVHAAMSLREQKIDAIVINNNPETVSTDFNTADHLYFEPLTEEDVLHVVKKENADGVLVQFGGQTAINLANGLEKAGVKIVGTDLKAIEAVEDRDQFYQLLQKLDIPHIPGESVMNFDDAKEVATKIGYPILIRPSYVIGGRGMVVVRNENQLMNYLENIKETSPGSRIFPLLIDRFITGSEVEIDAVCDGEDILIPGIFEHVERAGVHSGDSIAIFPAPSLNDAQKKLIESYAQKISKELDVKGIMNIQFVISEDKKTIYVLEVNPRASRTVPISSKITGVPMVDLATRVQMGEALEDQEWKLGLHQDVPFYAVKMPVFSTNKLPGVDSFLGPEMKSTGEAIGLGSTVETAMAKAFGWKEKSLKPLTKEDTIFLSMDVVYDNVIESLSGLSAKIAADEATAKLLDVNGIKVDQQITISEAQEICLDNGFQLMCSTNHNGEYDEHVKLREDALKSDTMCVTSNETLFVYIQAAGQVQEEPVAINSYTKERNQINKKERVLR